jgi:hypothetical protein
MKQFNEMTKNELLVEFRVVRNALNKLELDKDVISKIIVKKFGTEKQKECWVTPSEATLFEILLSGE